MSKNTILPEGMGWNEFDGLFNLSVDKEVWEKVYSSCGIFRGWKRRNLEEQE